MLSANRVAVSGVMLDVRRQVDGNFSLFQRRFALLRLAALPTGIHGRGTMP